MADKREQRLQAYKAVFAGPMGRLILEDLAQVGFAERTTLVAGDPHASSHNEGMRALYLHILARIRQANSPILSAEKEPE